MPITHSSPIAHQTAMGSLSSRMTQLDVVGLKIEVLWTIQKRKPVKDKTVLFVDSDTTRLCDAVNLLSESSGHFDRQNLRLVIAHSKASALALLRMYNDSRRDMCSTIDAIVSHLTIIDGEDHEDTNRIGQNPLGLCVIAEAIQRRLPFVLYSHESWYDDRPRGAIKLLRALNLGENLEFADPDVPRAERTDRMLIFRVFERVLKKLAEQKTDVQIPQAYM